MKLFIVFSFVCTLGFSQLVGNPCAPAPYNCDQCTQYQNQCFLPSCLEKIARIGSPLAGVGKLDPNLNGRIQFVDFADSKRLQVDVDFADSEEDPFEVNTDGTRKSCIDSVLFRLDNRPDLPHNQIGPVSFIRSFNAASSKRTYSFFLTPDQISGLTRLPSSASQIKYQGYYVMEFQVAGVPQARYFFTFTATFNADLTDVLSTEFKAVKEYDTLTCPSNLLDDSQCVTNVESEMAFCTDFSFDCAQQSFTSPELFINMDLYIIHKIVSPGFQNWQLHLDVVQFFNLAAGYFQPLLTGEYVYKPGYTVYKMKVSYVQNGVTIGVNSKLVPPSGRRMRRLLQEDESSKTTSSSSPQIECVKEKDGDKCPMSQEVIDKYASGTSKQTQISSESSAKSSSASYLVFFASILAFMAII